MWRRRRPGQVRDAILGFLGTREGITSIAEIQQNVSHQFGGQIAPSSIRSYLRLNTPQLFERPREGWYRLKAASGTTLFDVPDAPVKPDAAQSLAGPVFRHGRLELYQADCIDWLLGRGERTIHAVVTDPPYGLVEYSDKEQEKLRSGKGGVWRIPPSFDGHKRAPLPRFTTLDGQDKDRLTAFFSRWAQALYPVLVPGAHVLVAANPLLSYLVAWAVTGAGFERRGEVIRLVMTMRGGDRPKNAHDEFPEVSVMSRSMWESWLVFRKPIEGRVQDNLRKWKTGGLRRPSADKPFGDVIASHPTHRSERSIAPHPSLKPQDFLRKVVRAVLPLGEGIVLDPFAGSGSTLAAAEAVGYASIGVELDRRYVDVAKKAIPALSQLKPRDSQDR